MKPILIFLTMTLALPAETTAHAVLNSWLEAFNSGDRAKVAAFAERYAPQRVDHVADELEFRAQTGGFTLVRVLKDSDTEVEALMKERQTGSYVQLRLLLEGDPPKVKGMGLRPTEPPENERVPAASDADLAAQVTQALDARASADQFAGAMLIAKDGKVVLERAWGLADRGSGTKNTVDTRFRIGSMNKMFTSVSILQLVEKGKMSLDGTLADYWPDYPNRELARKVKVRHLLSHTGGTGDIFGPEFDQHRLELKTLEDYAKLYGSRALQFEPGSRFAYSNYGFVLLGLLIEKVTGKSYYDYVRENVFAPAGMRSTDSLPETERVERRATGYMKRDGAWIPNTDTLPWRASSAGGGYSTVGDLFRFAEALRGGKLISREMLAQASKDQTPGGAGYGFGLQTGKSFGHGGGAPGMNGDLRIFPDSGYVIAALSNLDPPVATRAADFVRDRLPRK